MSHRVVHDLLTNRLDWQHLLLSASVCHTVPEAESHLVILLELIRVELRWPYRDTHGRYVVLTSSPARERDTAARMFAAWLNDDGAALRREVAYAGRVTRGQYLTVCRWVLTTREVMSQLVRYHKDLDNRS